MSWYGDFNDPVTFLGLLKSSTGAQNYGDYNSPVYDSLLAQADAIACGDWVLADSSGVVFVPAARFEEVLTTAEGLAAREQQMIARVRNGEPVSVVMSHQYESMLKGS